MVDARGDEGLQRVRDAIRRSVSAAALDEHANRLLDEQGVAFRPFEHFLRGSFHRLARLSGELGQELLHQELALLVRQRLELDRGRAHASSTPPRPLLEQLGSRQADDEKRRADPVREVLDQLEQGLLGPVDVLEEEHERLHVGERHHDLARRPRDLLRAPLALEGFEHAGSEAEHVGDGLLLAALAELCERLFERIVVRDSRRSLDHLGERPVGDALAVRETASGKNAGALETVHELPREAALPDSRLPEDREEMRTPVANGARERVLEELELGLAADERRAWALRPRGTVDRIDEAPRPQRGSHPLQLERAGILDDQACSCETVCGRSDEDLARPRGLLESRREVHRLACGEGGLGVLDDELAGLDADPRFEPELFDGLAHRERGAGCPFGIVFVGLRNAERRQHRVSCELLHDPAMQRHAVGDLLEERVHATANDLGIRGGDQTRGVHEVDEQDRGELSLHDVSVETNAGVAVIPRMLACQAH